ncbi:hypothetical protein [Bacillus sp. EAC]|uniref:hypothetical protein n=1 Tax=Bacillus sp. EAC TaxID=1978338 RepID=UPI000B42FAD2|nr:hypothetical protein [Bacillus sp. EAC]
MHSNQTSPKTDTVDRRHFLKTLSLFLIGFTIVTPFHNPFHSVKVMAKEKKSGITWGQLENLTWEQIQNLNQK